MRAVVLSSGSKGNTTYVESGQTRLLIDLGNTCKYVVEKLKGLGVEPDTLDGIFVTHTHIDHIKGLKVFLHKYNIKVYATKGVLDELDFVENYYLLKEDRVQVGDIEVDVIKTSHDAPDSVGYVINSFDKAIVYITDTGYINHKYFPILSNREVYILESNHDIEMLNNGKYSFKLRQRILSDKGHLSNYDCARYLSDFIGERTKVIVLAHLSEENNTEELAYETLMERFEMSGQKVDEIIIAKQNEVSKEISIC